MKNKFFVSFFLMFSIIGFSQANLEFNTVIKYNSGVLVGSGGITSFTVTVPQGKVWKITSATLGPKSGSSISCYARIDGHLVAMIEPWRNTGSTMANDNKLQPFPLWLPEGTYTVHIKHLSDMYFSYSGIEFNVVN